MYIYNIVYIYIQYGMSILIKEILAVMYIWVYEWIINDKSEVGCTSKYITRDSVHGGNIDQLGGL